MSIISSCLIVLLSSTMSLLIFYLLDLCISDRGLLKSPILVVNSSVSPCYTHFDSLLLGTYTLRIGISSCSGSKMKGKEKFYD